ncbi:phenylalanine--tRNA ligase subunit alpha [Candidatus Micrarchaeota archaeon]|nr:phenylalanine--tRNA ligase subunit alpha [Candidatus Micrarchaeota archaeon]
MLHQYEKLIVESLLRNKKTLTELSSDTGLDMDSVMRFCYLLKEKNIAEIKEEQLKQYKLTQEGSRFLKEGFPEQRLLQKLKTSPLTREQLTQEESSIGLSWAKKNEWISFEKQNEKTLIKLTPAGKEALNKKYELQETLSKISSTSQEINQETLDNLLKRGSVELQIKKNLEITLTPYGKKISSEIEVKDEVNTLTKDMIVTGAWKKKSLREYDINSPVERYMPGKPHPLEIFTNKIRLIFLSMGFEEMEGPSVESSFWNFDALFQPQDHPARELADTFYLKKPERFNLPDQKLVQNVKKAHEEGWKYKWNEEPARLAILRTHTTSVSSRYLNDIKSGKRKEPAKYFCMGRVYRNEATDYKHLAEFHQLEGIVVWENANFKNLLGLLKEFYSKLGFDKIRFKPSFFPYTEPSLEVEVYFEKRKQWLELGGAGIFRPEVCMPLWGKYPVLAWGLSLERPLMLSLGLEDIRAFYTNNLEWLRNLSLKKLM